MVSYLCISVDILTNLDKHLDIWVSHGKASLIKVSVFYSKMGNNLRFMSKSKGILGNDIFKAFLRINLGKISSLFSNLEHVPKPWDFSGFS